MRSGTRRGRQRLSRAEIDIDAGGGGVLAGLVERDVGGRSLRLRGTAEVKIERRCRRCGCRGGCRRRLATARARIETILRIDRAAERGGFFPVRPGAVGEALELERSLLESLGVLAVRVYL